MSGYRRPATPAAVERQLRQEAGFGCARCGHPYIEYHHIVPWAQENHFRPSDMIALCGNCHPAVSNLGRDLQMKLKDKPFNIERGFVNGALEYDKRDLVFKVGGNWYEDTPTIVRFFDTPIISCKIKDGQAKVSLTLLDDQLCQTLVVVDNEVTFRINNLWDFEYSHNYVLARYGPRDIAVKMDFRGEEAVIEGQIWIGKQKIQLGSSNTLLPGNNVFSGCHIKKCATAFQFGEPHIPLAMRCRI